MDSGSQYQLGKTAHANEQGENGNTTCSPGQLKWNRTKGDAGT